MRIFFLLAMAFFPAPPAHAPAHVARGVLLSYGVGSAEGHLALRERDGKIADFYIAFPMRVNGRDLRCAFPQQCPQWPATLVVGKSRVNVTYWMGSRDGHQVPIAYALTNAR